MQLLINGVLSAGVNLVVLVAIPFAVYFLYHKLRHRRTLVEVARRAGLQIGKPRYLLLCVLLAFVGVVALVAWPLSMESFQDASSPQRSFRGLGIGGLSISLALLYGMIKTGFAEEFFFRGLVCGSLARRLPLVWANLIQALIFLLPHIAIVFIKPELWGILLLVFLGGLLTGWIRIKSESFYGPWIIHGALNTAMCLIVAARTVQ